MKMVIRESIRNYLKAKWGKEWKKHPSWRLSNPGDLIPWAAVELLPIKSEPLSKKDMDRALELLKKLGY